LGVGAAVALGTDAGCDGTADASADVDVAETGTGGGRDGSNASAVAAGTATAAGSEGAIDGGAGACWIGVRVAFGVVEAGGTALSASQGFAFGSAA
jgi:hypothetical protein